MRDAILCKYCNFFKNGKCRLLNIDVSPEDPGCSKLDLSVEKFFPDEPSPFTKTLIQWNSDTKHTPTTDDLIKMIETDSERKNFINDEQWEGGKFIWLKWLIEKVFEKTQIFTKEKRG